MLVVADTSQLNWWLRRFAPRVTLRLSPDLVEFRSKQGVAQAAAVATLVRRQKGDPLVAGIGDDPVTDAGAVRVPVFGGDGVLLERGEIVERFLRALLKRLPPSGGFILPVVLVEGLQSLDHALGGRQRAIVIRALARCGVGAVVIPDD